jgi:16S rRNA (guanine1516-N2)-methyltransferase
MEIKMNDKFVACVGKGGQRDMAESFAKRTGVPILDKPGENLTVLFDAKGVSLTGYGLTYQGDFEGMLHRVSDGRLAHEMLVRAAKTTETDLKGIDATAGMGEDAFLLAAYGYDMTLYEQNPVVAVLLKDALRRAKKHPQLKEIAGRMKLVEGNSVEELKTRVDAVDLIYLDPMFPGRQKSGLINKKLQLIQKLEPPCSDEVELFEAAIQAKPSKIIVKRPLKSPFLAGKNPTYELKGKAIRYDCYAL